MAPPTRGVPSRENEERRRRAEPVRVIDPAKMEQDIRNELPRRVAPHLVPRPVMVSARVEGAPEGPGAEGVLAKDIATGVHSETADHACSEAEEEGTELPVRVVPLAREAGQR